jgi:hypothetical protein
MRSMWWTMPLCLWILGCSGAEKDKDPEKTDADADADTDTDADADSDSDTDEDSAGATEGCRGTGETWDDVTGNGYDGSFVGMTPVWKGDGTISDPTHVTFDSTSIAYLELTDSDALKLATGSIEFWVRPQSLAEGNHMLFNVREAAEVAGIVLTGNSNGWVLYGSYAEGQQSWPVVEAGPAPVLDTWEHVVATWSPSGTNTVLIMYINGTEVAGATLQGSIGWGSTEPVQIGGIMGDATGNFDGDLALFRFWPGHLDADQVTTLYNENAAARFGLPLLTAPAQSATLGDPLVVLDATACDGT